LVNNLDGTWTGTGIFGDGTHTVEFEVRDECNNFRTGEVTFTITDGKAPTAICNPELNISLKTTGIAVITPQMIDGGSNDDCDDDQNLTFQIELDDPVDGPQGAEDFIEFGCGDLGPNTVILHVTDSEGNTATCTATVNVQNNLEGGPDDPCPPLQPTASVAGFIGNLGGVGVSDVSVALDAPGMDPYMTDADGNFLFQDLPVGNDYKVTADKDLDPLNGVTTWDIVLIRKHLLNNDPFDSPYKHIAADVTNDDQVTTFDILQLRQVILGQYATFPANTSWRFVDADYQFRDPVNPLSDDYPEYVMNANLNADNMDADFMAVKIGDLSGDAKPNDLVGSSPRNLVGNLSLEIDEAQLEAGSSQLIPVMANAFDQVNGMQFTLDMVSSLISFEGFESAALTMTEGNYSMRSAANGLIPVSWDADEPVSLQDGTVLFYIKVSANAPTTLSEAMTIGSSMIDSEAYMMSGHNMSKYDVNLLFNTDQGGVVKSEEFTLFQNRPNPFSEITTVGFHLPEAGTASMTIFDVTGKEIHRINGDFARGYNEIQIDAGNLSSGSVYYYQLEAGSNTATKKMVLIK
jgi:hypothetical protein